MGTGADTFAAADTKIAVVIYDIPRTVVTHLGRANHNTAMAIDTLIFHHMNNRP
jgi:hypothetical protein